MSFPKYNEPQGATNYANTPRPFSFVRPKFHRDTAEWLRDTLTDIKDDEFQTLADLRTKGIDEDNPKVQETRQNINYCITIIRDLERGLIDMVGPRPEEIDR